MKHTRSYTFTLSATHKLITARRLVISEPTEKRKIQDGVRLLQSESSTNRTSRTRPCRFKLIKTSSRTRTKVPKNMHGQFTFTPSPSSSSGLHQVCFAQNKLAFITTQPFANCSHSCCGAQLFVPHDEHGGQFAYVPSIAVVIGRARWGNTHARRIRVHAVAH